MTLAYKNLPINALVSEKFVTFEARRNHVFSTYIERMFERKGRAEQPYTKKRTQVWLSWLACKMQQHSQSILLIEHLQPSWLSTRGQRLVYTLSSRLFVGAILGFTEGLSSFMALLGEIKMIPSDGPMLDSR